jgi:hypothetical protein
MNQHIGSVTPNPSPAGRNEGEQRMYLNLDLPLSEWKRPLTYEHTELSR